MKFLVVIAIFATLICVLQAERNVLIKVLSAEDRSEDESVRRIDDALYLSGRNDRVHGCTNHANDRRRERNIDVNQARRVWKKVGSKEENGETRDIYEGTYTDTDTACPVKFRAFVSRRDGHLITIYRRE